MGRHAVRLAIFLMTALGLAANISAQGQAQATLTRVLDWYRDVVTYGHVEMASQYMADSYIEHDPNFAGGLKEFLQGHGQNPPRPIQPLPTQPAEAFVNGEFVVFLWPHRDRDGVTGTPYTYFTYDVVRVRDGKIQEHWNSLARTAPKSSPGPELPKAGTYLIPPGVPMTGRYDVSSLRFTPEERRNIDATVGFYRDIVQTHHHELASTYIAPDMIQRNPVIASSAEGLIAWFQWRSPKPDPFQPYLATPPDLLIAKNDIVVLMYGREVPNEGGSGTYVQNRFEIVRIRDGKVAEHWDMRDRKGPMRSPDMQWCLDAKRSDCPTP